VTAPSPRIDPDPPAARWFAAFICILYGFAKLNGAQFTILESELARPMGEVSGFWLTWHYFCYSKVYGTLLALFQIGCGVLLVVPRTTLAGALLVLPVAANILLIDVFYGVDLGGTLAAAWLLLFVAATIAPYRKRVRAAVLLDTLPRRPGRGAIAALALLIAGSAAFTYWVANYNNRSPTAIDGEWTVTAQTGTAAVPPWQRVFFEHNRAHMAVFREEGRPDAVRHFEVDTNRVVRIWERWLTKGTLLMQGQMRSADLLELDVAGAPTGGRLVLERVRAARRTGQ
jgi:hypothetical protein